MPYVNSAFNTLRAFFDKIPVIPQIYLADQLNDNKKNSLKNIIQSFLDSQS